MKLNKKIVAVNLLASVLLVNSAQAGLVRVKTPVGSGGTSSSGGSSVTKVITSEAVRENVSTGIANQVARCDGGQDQSIYFPQSLFKLITRDEVGLTISIKPNNKITVKVPPIYNGCGDFEPVLKQDNNTKNASIVMILKKDDKKLTYGQFIKCLEDKNIVKDGQINLGKVPGKDFSSTEYTIGYLFDKKNEVQKTAYLTFGYPTAFDHPTEGYGQEFEVEREKTNVPGEACMIAEDIAATPTYINKGKEAIIAEIFEKCKSGTAQEIADAKKSVGNAEALKDVAEKIQFELDARYLSKAKEELVQTLKDLGTIEERIIKNRDSMDEAKAKKEMTAYSKLVKELYNKFIDPAMVRLEELLKKREGLAEDSPPIKKIDEEIKALNKDIGEAFPKKNLEEVYSLMQKYGMIDIAKIVHDVALRSDSFKRVYAEDEDSLRKPRLTIEKANKEIETAMTRFDKMLVDWQDEYLVGKGNTAPLQKTEKEIASTAARMNQRLADYQQSEMKSYNSYCGVGMLGSVNNPVKCREFISGKSQRDSIELKMREKDLTYIRGKISKRDKLGTGYNRYTASVAAKEVAKAEMYDPSSISGHEVNFSERFTGWYASPVSTAYDPSMYNLGGVTGAMNMGVQQQMMYPAYQQNVQGQYQMPQMQQMGQQRGAWAGL